MYPNQKETAMHRAAIYFAVLALFGAGPLVGQEQRPAAHVYEAFYRISFSDLDAWNQRYWEYSVPILEQLQEEGVIEGWTQWQHETGSEYNIRFTARTYDWASLDTFWSEYLSRLREVQSDVQWNAGSRMVLEDRDEIWDIATEHWAEPERETTYMYTSTFRVNFADMEEWNRIWSDVAGPLLQAAIDEGILNGWVKLGHNTGGPHNSKVLFFFDSWDDIDDFWGMFLGTMAEAHADDWARMTEIFKAHDDVIWVPTTRGEM
jgi:hypothetical protein